HNSVASDPPPLAATRLASLPVVRSACAKLSVLYAVTKCSHPILKSACDMLESSVTALGAAARNRVSPVIAKLEPQISIANDVACKSLDWLETSFPILLSPTEQVISSKSSISCAVHLKNVFKRHFCSGFVSRLLPLPRTKCTRFKMW
uniref:Perilipin n=1 Tax=Acanthochromis polyacanthus TaxID=80966 RepID=A0A3Q1ES05_9TELE